ARRQSRQHPPHHHGRDRRRGRGPAAVGGAVGCGGADRVGVGPDNPRRGGHRGALLRGAAPGAALSRQLPLPAPRFPPPVFNFVRSIIATPSAYSVVGAAERCTSLSMLSRMRRVIRRMLCSDSLSSGCVSTASASSSSPSARIVASALFTSCRIVRATWLITATRSPWIARA